MQSNRRKFLTATLLAIYGVISLLGHGLHWLAPHSGHQHGSKLVECASPPDSSSCDCAFHRRAADQERSGTEASLKVGACAGCSHDCGICHLLAQVRSVPAKHAPAILWQSLVTTHRLTRVSLWFESASFRRQVPRGPPLSNSVV